MENEHIILNNNRGLSEELTSMEQKYRTLMQQNEVLQNSYYKQKADLESEYELRFKELRKNESDFEREKQQKWVELEKFESVKSRFESLQNQYRSLVELRIKEALATGNPS